MRKIEKLPETVFVYIDGEDDFSFLNTNETLEEAAEQGETRIVGVYKLVETKRVTLKVSYEIVES